MDKHYTVSVKMLAMTRRRMRIRCDATIWFRDEEVFSVRNEQMMVTGSWVQLGVINLHDELTEEEREASNGGILIVPGEEEHDNGNDEFVDTFARSYLRVSMNFVEVREEEVVTGVIVPRSYVILAKWGVCTLLGLAMQHAFDIYEANSNIAPLSGKKKTEKINLNRNELH